MGKQGPCYHCGITYTPLWRNGPPEKPVLCNACGSRWRTKGTLANYTPLHARTFEGTDCSDYRSARGKKGSQNPKQQRSHKWNEPGQDAEFGDFGSDLHYATSFEEDVSNRSSSGSGISYSEGCIQYGGTVGVDSAGSVHTSLWDSHIPAKKRTCMHRKRPSSVEKLTKGLRYILHEQDTSHLSLCSESEDLLFPCKAPMVASEIGLGSMFIRQPKSTAWEEESEASSLVIASSTQLQNEDEYLPGLEKEKLKHITENVELSQEHSDRSSMHNKGVLENFHYNKNGLLQSCLSLLISVELKDIINFDSFMEILTVQDRAYLMEYVSPVDVEKNRESLQCMFSSVQFEEALTNFQDLLSEGIFDMYASRLKPHAQQVFQKLLTTELSNSKCIEEYFRLQRQIKPEKVLYSTKVLQKKDTTKRKGSSLHFKSGMYLTVEKSSGSKSGQVITGSDNSMKIPGNRQKVRTSASYHESMDTGCTSKSAMELDVEPKNEFCLSASSLFTSPLERNSILLDSIGSIVGESFDQELLLDFPSNISFQQAELLQSPDWKCKASKDSLDDAGNLDNPNTGEEMAGNTWGSEDSLEWNGLLRNPSSVQSGQTLPNGAVLYSGKTLP